MPGDDQSDIRDTNVLGETSFKKFWAATGFKILSNMISKNMESELEVIIIKNEKGTNVSIEEFLKQIKKFQIEFN